VAAWQPRFELGDNDKERRKGVVFAVPAQELGLVMLSVQVMGESTPALRWFWNLL